MADPVRPESAALPTGAKIKFHYLKSNFFRVIHADGAMGGLTPSVDIFFTLYSQRAPIPQITVQRVMPDGQLGEEIAEEREQRDGIIREPEVGVVMSLAVAKAFHQWLTARLEQADKTIQQMQREHPATNGTTQ